MAHLFHSSEKLLHKILKSDIMVQKFIVQGDSDITHV